MLELNQAGEYEVYFPDCEGGELRFALERYLELAHEFILIESFREALQNEPVKPKELVTAAPPAQPRDRLPKAYTRRAPSF